MIANLKNILSHNKNTMKNILKIILGCFIIVLIVSKTYADHGTVRKKLMELSCKDNSGTEVSIGADCLTGNGSCVENVCPKGTGVE